MEQLTEQKIIDTIIKWCEGATDNVADGVRFKEVAKELSESTPIEGITDDLEKLFKQAFIDADTLYKGVNVDLWWHEFKLQHNL